MGRIEERRYCGRTDCFACSHRGKNCSILEESIKEECPFYRRPREYVNEICKHDKGARIVRDKNISRGYKVVSIAIIAYLTKKIDIGDEE